MKREVKTYSEMEVAYLQSNINYTPGELALLLSRTPEGIRDKIKRLNDPETKREARRKAKERQRAKESIRLGNTGRQVWTKAEEKQIMTSKKTDEELSILMGRTVNSIQKKRHRLRKEGWGKKK